MSFQLSLPEIGEMAQVSEQLAIDERTHLIPPSEALIRPLEDKIHTPIDDRGLVNVPALIDEMNSFVVPGYRWRGHNDAHHLYWYERLYNERNLFRDDVGTSRNFRGMPLHQLEVPRELHEFLHIVTLPVEVPSDEVMGYRLEAWDIARSLFVSVSVIGRHKEHGDEQLARSVNKDLIGNKLRVIEECVRRTDRIPDPFKITKTRPFRQILGVEKAELITFGHINQAMKEVRRIGKVSAHGSIRMHQVNLLAA